MHEGGGGGGGGMDPNFYKFDVRSNQYLGWGFLVIFLSYFSEMAMWNISLNK